MNGWECLDGNEAAARVAHALSEVIAIYPITPASAMGEHADEWSAGGRTNLWGAVPQVIEMQSEAGAAGTLHGALLEGALGTTFTSSQGLLLMLPNMFKMAGELLPAVIHVAARTVATHALSIFGDHSDVMAARSTGFAMLCASSVQEAHDFALIAHASALETRLPFLHFFDGFRTSHEIDKIQVLDDADLASVIRESAVLAHRQRGLSPDHPVLRGSAQNPDVFFQSREASNPVYEGAPAAVQAVMERLALRTGRRYGLIDYHGPADAERVIVLMGSAAGAAEETVDALNDAGEKVGLVKIRLYRPFPVTAFLRALPSTVTRIAVLDRTKEPGAIGEPLYLDVVAALAEADHFERPLVVGGRYGLASKEVTPSMLAGVFDELSQLRPRHHFTVGIVDDVTFMSIKPRKGFSARRTGLGAVFYGLGSDGTVGATKSSVSIIGENTDNHAQGYFVYDSKKSGALTVSHLRFGDAPIRSTYLIKDADFVSCHHIGFLDKLDVLGVARRGATLLLNAPYPPDEVWDHLNADVQETILEKDLDVWTIDASSFARDAGLGRHINIVMQACFFALSDVLPREQAMRLLNRAIERTYAKRGEEVVARNRAAAAQALAALTQLPHPATVTSTRRRPPPIAGDAPEFVERVTARLLAGEGDLLPVSAMPVDGTFPTSTSTFEKRAIALDIPVWDPSLCIDCGKCAIVCPHAAIRMKVYPPDAAAGGPEGFPSKSFRSRDLPGHQLTIQVSPDDCTGCGICVEVCPAAAKDGSGHKSIDMRPVAEHRPRELANWEFFTAIPPLDRSLLPHDSVKGSQVLEPLFEFSGACAGCGETPYLKLLTQLFGDRVVIANATGCSSIFGGNLPTTPWSTNAAGRGPAWANSLFEDNAEFGLGLRAGLDAHNEAAQDLLRRLVPVVGGDLAMSILEADQTDEAGIDAQRSRIVELRRRLAAAGDDAGAEGRHLETMAEQLVKRSLWIVGGDGWAYDIGSGGLDHVLASGRNVNILVLDTEVYSNTGGQASKATPRAAAAKFAASGKAGAKKDLGLVAMSYGDVYVAQISLGGSDVQTVKALLEADAWPGPALVIAYCSCVAAHGFEESQTIAHQKTAVRSGHWPLYRFHPGRGDHEHPFSLDSHEPAIPLREFAMAENRFAALARQDPARSEELLTTAQADVTERWRLYEQLAGVERTMLQPDKD